MSWDFLPLLRRRHEPENRAEYDNFEYGFTIQKAIWFTTFFPHLRFLGLRLLNAEPYPPFWHPEDHNPRPHRLLSLDLNHLSTAVSTSDIGSTDEFQGLMFLDMTCVSRAPDFKRQFTFNLFEHLAILKLGGLQLTDEMIPAFIGTGRLFSLDVSENNLTDKICDLLVRYCISANITQPLPVAPTEPLITGIDELEDVPCYSQDPVNHEDFRTDNVVELRPDSYHSFNEYVREHGQVAQHQQPLFHPTDDILCRTGLTHLYISKNKLTCKGVRTLLSATNRLQVLDVGCVTSTLLGGTMKDTINYFQPRTADSLLHNTGTQMGILRIHHSVVTNCPTIIPSGRSNGWRRAHLWKAETVYGPGQNNTPGCTVFFPSENHRLRDLTLTGIPTISYGFILTAIQEFLSDAANQEAHLRASAPTARRALAQLPGLRKLTLELVKEDCVQDPERTHLEVDQDLCSSMASFSFFAPDTFEESSAAPQVEVLMRNSFPPSYPTPMYNVEDALRHFLQTLPWTGEVVFKFGDAPTR